MVYILFCRVQLDVVDLNWEYWDMDPLWPLFLASHCCIQGLQLVKSLQAANATWTTSGSCWSNGEGSCIRQISAMPRNASSDSCSSRRSCSKKWDCNMIAGHLGHCSQFVQHSLIFLAKDFGTSKPPEWSHPILLQDLAIAKLSKTALGAGTWQILSFEYVKSFKPNWLSWTSHWRLFEHTTSVPAEGHGWVFSRIKMQHGIKSNSIGL